MTRVTEWLANMPMEYVVATIVVLFVIRIVLGRYKSPIAKSSAEMAESALMAIALVFLLIRPFIVQAFFIPSGSMRPTLLERDHILVNKFIYRFTEPKRGDIVVFKCPEEADPRQVDYIKRLMGLPGDVIEVKEGLVYRNGKALREPFLLEPGDIRYDMPPVKVRPGKFFVMGDNRNDSNDSHRWGQLDRNRVLGKAMVTFWPIGRAGILH
jgi:signal peptidase I